jgi:hypothetical protein
MVYSQCSSTVIGTLSAWVDHRAVVGTGAVHGMAIVRILGRVWIPLVVLLAIGCSGYVVSGLRGAFASEKRPSYSEDYARNSTPFQSKQVVYEVFGAGGAVADISYFDVNSVPQQVEGAALPWSLTMTSDSPAVIGSIVAQGAGNSIGCRIVVDGEIKAEKISNEASAFTHCLFEGA